MEALFNEKALRAFGHLVGGGIALTAGAIQVSTRLRIRRPVVHRAVGRVYLGAVFVSGMSAFLLARTSSGGLAAHWGFGLLAALCLAAVTLRIYLPVSAVAGIPFDQAYPTIAWLCWVPNLIVAEWFFVRGRVVALEASTRLA